MFEKLNLDLGKMISIVAVCLLAALFLKLINKVLRNPEKVHLKFLRSVLRVAVFLLSGVLILNNFDGFQTFSNTILSSSGLIVAVLGFACQSSLTDFIAGVFISFFKPFDINDRITLKDKNIAGTIEDVTIRHTVIKTFTNSRLIIPNSIMNQAVIENNHMTDPRSGNFMDVLVAYDTDLEKAKQVVASCIEAHPQTINADGEKAHDTYVFTREFADSGIWLRANVWTQSVDTNFRVCSEIRDSIIEAFRKNEIEIPYHKVDVCVKKSQELQPVQSDAPTASE